MARKLAFAQCSCSTMKSSGSASPTRRGQYIQRHRGSRLRRPCLRHSEWRGDPATARTTPFERFSRNRGSRRTCPAVDGRGPEISVPSRRHAVQDDWAVRGDAMICSFWRRPALRRMQFEPSPALLGKRVQAGVHLIYQDQCILKARDIRRDTHNGPLAGRHVEFRVNVSSLMPSTSAKSRSGRR